jgi:hypothetical protein
MFVNDFEMPFCQFAFLYPDWYPDLLRLRIAVKNNWNFLRLDCGVCIYVIKLLNLFFT